MKICVLACANDESTSEFAELIPVADPSPHLPDHTCERHEIHKATAVRQILDLAQEDYDLFINLCDGAADEDRAGIEVIRTLERLHAPFTGATSAFYDPSRETLKRVCHYWGISTPAYVMAETPIDVQFANESLRFPLIVKHPRSYSSIGLTRASKVENRPELEKQCDIMIKRFGATLIEEFIEGREFTVLVVENPNSEHDPIAFTPIEFTFPAHESFKHFDLKWKDFQQMVADPATDHELITKLQRTAVDLFKGMNATGYGRCDFRLSSEGQVFTLEINDNCEVFYPRASASSADTVLLNSTNGYRRFLDLLLAVAEIRGTRQPTRYKVFLDQNSRYGIYASSAFDPGEVILLREEQPHILVSRQHVEAKWDASYRQWFHQYAYPMGDHVYVMWSDDPRDWKPINHSCDPNSWLEGLNLVARRTIRAGEQISIDYATFCNEDMETFACSCGSNVCRTSIQGTDYLQPFLDRYGDHISDYVRRKRLRLNPPLNDG